ncbi:MAG: uracil-DNA glycosylase [bacterium]|nr:uracil-DNA glycosylase [bacterium]
MNGPLDDFREILRLTRGCLERLAADGAGRIPRRAAALAADARRRDIPSMEELARAVSRCRKCALWETRSKTVFGAGAVPAALVLVGEAPGAEEDRQGVPFVGRAGALLTKMLAAIGLDRDAVYITNILKCRPPGNRDPRPEEVGHCEPYLLGQLGHLRPRLILALGRHAAQTLLQTTRPIGALRGRFHDYRGIKIIPTFHPAYLLRNPDEKRRAWEDLKKVRAFLDGAA